MLKNIAHNKHKVFNLIPLSKDDKLNGTILKLIELNKKFIQIQLKLKNNTSLT